MGWDMVRGVPSPANYRVWGSVVSSPSGVQKRILAYFEGHRTLLFVSDKNLRGKICTSVPLLEILGDLSPASSPVINAHASGVTRVSPGAVRRPPSDATEANSFTVDSSALSRSVLHRLGRSDNSDSSSSVSRSDRSYPQSKRRRLL